MKPKRSRAERELDQRMDELLHTKCPKGNSPFAALITEGRKDGATYRTYFCKNCGLKRLEILLDPPEVPGVPVASRKPLPEDNDDNL